MNNVKPQRYRSLEPFSASVPAERPAPNMISGVKVGNILMSAILGCYDISSFDRDEKYKELYRLMTKSVHHEIYGKGHAARHYYDKNEVQVFIRNWISDNS